MICNICGCQEFVDMNIRKGVKCKQCLSLERTRLLWLFIQRLELKPHFKVLHIAPERGIYGKLKEILDDENYIAADFDPSGYKFVTNCQKIDLANMEEWPSNYFDCILHSHVMEHIPCNLAYTFFHLHRMLKPDGHHLCVIPFMRGCHDECFAKLEESERQRRFGQFDHVRRIGCEDRENHLGKILNLPLEFDATKYFSEEMLQKYNIPQASWRGYTPDTVLCFCKDDYKLRPTW